MRALEACPAKGRAPDALARAPLRAWSFGHLACVQVSPGRLARSWGRPAGLPAAEASLAEAATPGGLYRSQRYARNSAARQGRDGLAC